MSNWLDKFQSNLLEVLYRADQPRHPAGTPEGGRFAPAGGAGGVGSPEERIMKFISGSGSTTIKTLSKLTPEQRESVAKAMDDTLGKHGVQVEEIGLYKPGRRSKAYGTLAAFDHKNNTISLNETYLEEGALKSMMEKSSESMTHKFVQEQGLLRMSERITESLLNQGVGPDGNYHNRWGANFTPEELQGKLAREAEIRVMLQDGPRKFTISEVANDPLYAIIKHESYHAVYNKHNLADTWAKNIGTTSTRDMGRVSEYALSDVSEAFSEVATAIDLGVDVPVGIKRAFEGTIRTYNN